MDFKVAGPSLVCIQNLGSWGREVVGDIDSSEGGGPEVHLNSDKLGPTVHVLFL
jgi:hypothetical protein